MHADSGTSCDRSIQTSLQLVGARSNHELRLDEGVELSFSEGLELHGTLLEGEALLVSVLGDLGSHVVSDLGVEASDEHETGKFGQYMCYPYVGQDVKLTIPS